jgi:adenine-specific DNA-methyltransferase
MPIKYIPYFPNTVEGQAILDNITRTQRVLRYRENNKIYDRIKRGMPYYETEVIETVGDTSTKNLVIRGECISACAYLKEQGIQVDLVYIDPPFASGADYAKKVYIRRNPKLAEKIAKAEQEMEIDELKAFEEKMYGDIWQKEDYLNWMYENLAAIKAILSETGSIFVHLDWHISHYVKILLDEVFGEFNFKNEIVWGYSGGAIPKDRLPKKHDVIFWYSHSTTSWIYNPEFKDYSEKTKQRGRTAVKGENAVLRNEGTPITDWWTDIAPITSPTDFEKQYYSTQKPEKLLQRLINIASADNMLVADFFGGSGVSAKVANDLGRNFIHVDVGLNSIQTIRDRLIQANAYFKILEIKDGVSLFRNPQQTMDKLATLIPALQRNVPSLSDFWFGAVLEANNGTVPVYVPNLLNTQEKVLDIHTINKIINQELPNLEIDAKKVIVYFIDIDEPEQLQKFIQDNNATQIEVELKDLKNLLHEVVLEDQIAYAISNNGNEYTVELNKIVSDRLIQKIEAFNQKGQANDKKGEKTDLLEENADSEKEEVDEKEVDEETPKKAKKKFDPIVISDDGLELIELVSLDCKNQDGEWHSTTEIKIDKLGYMVKDGVKTKQFWDGKITSTQKPLRLKVRNISGDETVIQVKE